MRTLRTELQDQVQVLVLLSGGIDSAACAHFYMKAGHVVEALHVDYGQAARIEERRSAELISSRLGIGLKTIVLSEVTPKGDGLIQGRNALLLFVALLELQREQGLIAIGVHSGTEYYDCSPDFIIVAQSILDGYADGRIRVVAPFLNWTKDQVFDYARDGGLPLNLTYSCESGGPNPCGKCRSCLDLEAAHVC